MIPRVYCRDVVLGPAVVGNFTLPSGLRGVLSKVSARVTNAAGAVVEVTPASFQVEVDAWRSGFVPVTLCSSVAIGTPRISSPRHVPLADGTTVTVRSRNLPAGHQLRVAVDCLLGDPLS